MRERQVAGGAIAAIGVVLGFLQLRHVGATTATLAFDTAPFVLVSASLVYVGAHVARGDGPDRHGRRVLGWTVGGMALFAAVTALVALDGGVRGDLWEWVGAAIDNVSAGAIAGVLVGMYDVRGLERLAEVKRQRDRIEAFAGEAASLNRYGKALNESDDVAGVAALCVEAVEVVIGRPAGAFVLVEHGEARVVDDALADADSRGIVRDVAASVAGSTAIETRTHEDRPPLAGGVPLSITIPVDDRTAVLVAATGSGRLTDEELDLLELLAAHAATALTNLRDVHPSD